VLFVDTGPLSHFACSQYLAVLLCAAKCEIDPVSAKITSSRSDLLSLDPICLLAI
jgi:hypothetical protein